MQKQNIIIGIFALVIVYLSYQLYQEHKFKKLYAHQVVATTTVESFQEIATSAKENCKAGIVMSSGIDFKLNKMFIDFNCVPVQ